MSATPRWLVGVVIFAVGIGVGALAYGFGTSDPADVGLDEAIAVGCGNHATLIVDAEDLPEGMYELRAPVDGRMLPMINSITYPLIGEHRDHQSVVPDNSRLLLVATVPVGRGNELRYELVAEDSEPVLSGTVQRNGCAPGE